MNQSEKDEIRQLIREELNGRKGPIGQEATGSGKLRKGENIHVEEATSISELSPDVKRRLQDILGTIEGSEGSIGVEKGEDKPTLISPPGHSLNDYWFRDMQFQYDQGGPPVCVPTNQSGVVSKEAIKYIQTFKKTYRPTICVDFDGVIHKHNFAPDFSTWFDLFDIMPGAELGMNQLYDAGWYIIIYTLRQVDGRLLSWLNSRCIPYHDINGHREGRLKGWGHNPWLCSNKPMYDVILDDRCICFIDGYSEGIFPWDDVIRKLKFNFPLMKWRLP